MCAYYPNALARILLRHGLMWKPAHGGSRCISVGTAFGRFWTEAAPRRSILFCNSIACHAQHPASGPKSGDECRGVNSIAQIYCWRIAGGSKRPGSCGIGAMNADVMPRHHIYCQDLLPCSEISGALPASASLVMNIPVILCC